MTNVSFTRNTSATSMNGVAGVFLTRVNGRQVTPKLVYRSELPGAEALITSALNSGLLGRITAAILKS
jgi:hypothetical protein